MIEMLKKCFLDTCVIYAALNVFDTNYGKSLSIIENLIQSQSEIVISQYVFFEFIRISIYKAAQDFFDSNPTAQDLPKEVHKKIVDKIEDQLFTLEALEIELTYINLPGDTSELIEQILYEIPPRQIVREHNDNYTKMIGVIDLVHLICCLIYQCDDFITIDSDFKNPVIQNKFSTHFHIKVV